MKLVSLRADGSLHRIWQKAESTVQPWTYRVPANSPVMEASGHVWSSPYPVIAFFYPNSFFQIFMLLKSTGTDYYCNIILPPVFGPDVTFVDLDLDVIIQDGQAQLVDETDLLTRQSMYLETWVDSAWASSRELIRRFETGWGPFCPATAERWRGGEEVN